MAKALTGQVVSLKMTDTAVVEITRRIAHPLYKKLMKRSQKFKVALNGHTLNIGDSVEITETKKIAKGKYFKVAKVVISKATDIKSDTKEDKNPIANIKSVKQTRVSKKKGKIQK